MKAENSDIQPRAIFMSCINLGPRWRAGDLHAVAACREEYGAQEVDHDVVNSAHLADIVAVSFRESADSVLVSAIFGCAHHKQYEVCDQNKTGCTTRHQKPQAPISFFEPFSECSHDTGDAKNLWKPSEESNEVAPSICIASWWPRGGQRTINYA